MQTELIFIIDRSGSMSGFEKDTIGGYNSLLDKQKQEEGEAFVTTVLFDDQYEVICDHQELKTVDHMDSKTYFPRGTTALLDAIGKTINLVKSRIENLEEKPRVVFVITTDGLENASTEYNKSMIVKMIDEQQKKDWIFMFIGADMDAVKEGGSIGIKTTYSRTYTKSSAGMSSVYSSVSKVFSNVRKAERGISLDELESDISNALDEIE